MILLQKLKEQFPKIRSREPLKNHCTFRVGGSADFFYELSNIEELPKLITFSEENGIKYRMIGRGSNMLFTDKGYRGLIVKNISNKVMVTDDEIQTDSGVLLGQLVRLSVDNNLSGLEPLYGLPGTIGGAVWGNAGVPKTEISMFLKAVSLFNTADGIREIPAAEILFNYRRSSLQEMPDVILRVTLKLKKGIAQESKELIKKIDEIRRGKQPIGYTAGSFFKNPAPDKTAGYLIEQCGLKGFKIGDAGISEKHANFFMNHGHSTASELLELAAMAQKKVKEKFGIQMEMEVKIIGDL